MDTQIRGQVEKLTATFIVILEREYNKYLDMQKDVAKVIERHNDNEAKRKVEKDALHRNIDLQRQKLITSTDRNNTQADALQAQVEGYNNMKGQLAKELNETKHNLSESETIKQLSSKQLEKNKEVENTYNDKIRYLKDDENKIEERRKAVTERERLVDIKERTTNKLELRLAEERIQLMERKDRIKAHEARLKIEWSHANA